MKTGARARAVGGLERDAPPERLDVVHAHLHRIAQADALAGLIACGLHAVGLGHPVVVGHAPEGHKAVVRIAKRDKQPRLPNARDLTIAGAVPLLVAPHLFSQEIGQAHAVGTAFQIGGLTLAL